MIVHREVKQVIPKPLQNLQPLISCVGDEERLAVCVLEIITLR